MKTSQSSPIQRVTLPTMNTSSGYSWLHCGSTGLITLSGTVAFERSTVVWVANASQPFTVIWESAGISRTEATNSESFARW